MTPGAALERERSARGLSLDQVAGATRIRPAHLAAIEAGDFGKLPGPVYVRGYLKGYATYLGLDADVLLKDYDAGAFAPESTLSIGGLSPLPAQRGLVLTAPRAAAVGLAVLALLFAAYTYRQLDSLRQEVPAPSAAPAPPMVVPSTPAPAVALTPAAPSPSHVSVVVRASAVVWIDVSVDGKAQYGDAGRVFQPGDQAAFTGQKIKVSSGKAAATLITLDGRDLGPLGAGVATREFTAQN